MKREETIIVTIGPDGLPTVEVQGHPGPNCQALTRSLEATLGQTVTDQKTPEYYQLASEPSRVRLDQS